VKVGPDINNNEQDNISTSFLMGDVNVQCADNWKMVPAHKGRDAVLPKSLCKNPKKEIGMFYSLFRLIEEKNYQ
jgi:hypothetical protein